ncbi:MULTISPECIES: septum formation initiator family protein [unclassified Streptomyces]|uniref:septum formation initiator family protein n=1 Tax=unclassified Streptomyces TaxID=2593676 RepID=UPI0033F691FE
MSRKPELRGRAARLARLFPAGRGQAARTPFVLLVVLLLGGGLIGLLMLNSALSEGAFQREGLQKDTKNLTDEEQALQRDIDSYSAPDALQLRARQLGMVPGGDPAFLNADGSVKGVPSAAPEPPPAEETPLSLLPPEALTPSPSTTDAGAPATTDPASPTTNAALPTTNAAPPSAQGPAPALGGTTPAAPATTPASGR